MAFPTTGILDNFDRANAPNLGPNWTNAIFGANPARWTIASNKAASLAGPQEWYSAAQFGPGSEAYITLGTTLDSFFDGESNIDSVLFVYARLQTPGSAAVDGYFHVVYPPTSGGYLARVDNGVATVLGATWSGVGTGGSVGDTVGIEAVGSTLTAYQKLSGGSWGSLGSRVDATYSESGYVGFGMNISGSGITYTFDDFGGGTIGGGAPPAAPPAQLPHLLGAGAC